MRGLSTFTHRVVPRPIRHAVREMLEQPVLRFLGWPYSGLCSCLLYHRVTGRSGPASVSHPWAGLIVDQKRFEEQIKYLSRNYHCLHSGQAVELLTRGELLPHSAIVTFDDGYRDNLVNALPVLEKYDVPATIFVTTGLIDRRSRMWWFELEFILQQLERLEVKWKGLSIVRDVSSVEQKCRVLGELNLLFKRLPPEAQEELLSKLGNLCPASYVYNEEVLSWDEVHELARHPLITIGAHTKTHPVLSCLSTRELLSELQDSKVILEENLGLPVREFCYPFGSLGEAGRREFEACRAAGFRSAFTTRWGHIHSAHRRYPWALPRITVGYFDTLENFAWKLSGVSSLVYGGWRPVVTL